MTQLATTSKITEEDRLAIELWLNTKTNEHTKRAYKRDIQDFLHYVNKGLDDVTLNDCLDYVGSMSSYSDATIARKVSTIKSFFKFAHSLGRYQFNVAAAIPQPKVTHKVYEKVLPIKEIKTLIRVATNMNPTYGAIFRLVYNTGMRIGNALSLRWENITETDKGGIVLFNAKNNFEVATTISRKTMDKLKELDSYGTEGWVFPGRGDKPLTRQGVGHFFNRVLKKARLRRDATIHWLRHSHITHAQEAGANPMLVAKSVGHRKVDTTLRYTHNKPTESSGDYVPDA